MASSKEGEEIRRLERKLGFGKAARRAVFIESRLKGVFISALWLLGMREGCP